MGWGLGPGGGLGEKGGVTCIVGRPDMDGGASPASSPSLSHEDPATIAPWRVVLATGGNIRFSIFHRCPVHSQQLQGTRPDSCSPPMRSFFCFAIAATNQKRVSELLVSENVCYL